MVRRKSNRPVPKANATSGKNFSMNKTVKKRRVNRIAKEIKQLQRTTKLLIPKAPFARLVRQIMLTLFPRSENLRLQSTALEALQEAAEMYLVQYFEDCLLICSHSKRVTLMVHDMMLCRRLRGRADVINK